MHFDRTWIVLRSIHVIWLLWKSVTRLDHQCEHGAYKHSLLACSFNNNNNNNNRNISIAPFPSSPMAHIDIFYRFKSVISIKSLTGNIQILRTRSFLQYLNEASDVLDLVISSIHSVNSFPPSVQFRYRPDNYTPGPSCLQVDKPVFLDNNNHVT